MWSRMTPRRWLLAVGALVMLLVVASVIALFFIADIGGLRSEGKSTGRRASCAKGLRKVVEDLEGSHRIAPADEVGHPCGDLRAGSDNHEREHHLETIVNLVQNALLFQGDPARLRCRKSPFTPRTMKPF